MRIHAVLATAILLLLSGPSRAAVDEVEPNDTIGTANDIAGPEEVNGLRTVDPQDFDYFRFTGLTPGEAYLVSLDNIFLGFGLFEEDGTLLDSIAFESPLELDATADESGEVIVGVCGHAPPPGNQSVLDCTATATGAGEYVLTLPEPGVVPGSIAALGLLAAIRRRQRFSPL
jgi:hypothetical protein